MLACVDSEYSNQSAHQHSLIRVLVFLLKKCCAFGYQYSAHRRLWSDCADAQSDQNRRCAHIPTCYFCWTADLTAILPLRAKNCLQNSDNFSWSYPKYAMCCMLKLTLPSLFRIEFITYVNISGVQGTTLRYLVLLNVTHYKDFDLVCYSWVLGSGRKQYAQLLARGVGHELKENRVFKLCRLFRFSNDKLFPIYLWKV